MKKVRRVDRGVLAGMGFVEITCLKLGMELAPRFDEIVAETFDDETFRKGFPVFVVRFDPSEGSKRTIVFDHATGEIWQVAGDVSLASPPFRYNNVTFRAARKGWIITRIQTRLPRNKNK